MKQTLVAGVVAGAVVVGAGVLVPKLTTPALPDVEVPAIELSNAEGVDATVAWLDLFNQTSGNGTDQLDSGSLPVPAEVPLIVIDPQNSPGDFDKILDSVVGNAGSQLKAVTSPGSGPDAVTYLIPSNGS